MILPDTIFGQTKVPAIHGASGFARKRWNRNSRSGTLFPGVLYGGTTPEDTDQELEFFAYKRSRNKRTPLCHMARLVELPKKRVAALLYNKSPHCMAAFSHTTYEFQGTGIGQCAPDYRRTGGCTWAKGALDRGATFRFLLPHAQHRGGDE